MTALPAPRAAGLRSLARALLTDTRPEPGAAPSPAAIDRIVADLRLALFPGVLGGGDGTAEAAEVRMLGTLDRLAYMLDQQIERALVAARDAGDPRQRAVGATNELLVQLPALRVALAQDVRAALDGDPAARSEAEVILCSPGVYAVTCHRVAHALHTLGVPLLPRMLSAHAHTRTGVDIHPAAVVGERFFIDHGTGVVVGETARIGARVRLYQGVTLGARSFQQDERGALVKGEPRHPIVEDDVVIFAGATVLGRVVVGRGAVIGGGVWLTRSVPPGHRVLQAATREERFTEGAGI